MDEQHHREYTVEFQDPSNRVTYFNHVVASSVADAKGRILSRHPDVLIRAVTINPIDDRTSSIQ